MVTLLYLPLFGQSIEIEVLSIFLRLENSNDFYSSSYWSDIYYESDCDILLFAISVSIYNLKAETWMLSGENIDKTSRSFIAFFNLFCCIMEIMYFFVYLASSYQTKPMLFILLKNIIKYF